MNDTFASEEFTEGVERAAARSRIAARAARDFEAIAKQIVRFGSMTHKALTASLQKNRSDAFCMIPHPSGRGSLLCGSIAFRRFDQLSERILELDPFLKGCIEPSRARRALIESFVLRVLKEKRGIDPMTAMLILDEVVKALRSSLRDVVHFLPCVLFQHGGPAEFSIGPVKFSRTRTFFNLKREALRDSVLKDVEAHVAQVETWAAKTSSRDGLMTKADSERFVRNLQARAIRTYRAYPWVAEVQVVGRDGDTAKEFATKTVEAALNVVRILLGAGITEKVRLAWSRGDALRTAGMWADDSGVIHVSVGSNSMAPVGALNWYDGLSQGDGVFLNTLGSAISVFSNPRPIFHLHQRFLDSIHWFGDAATEIEATVRVIKYTSGIERLIFGGYDRDRKRRTDFAKRLSVLFDAFGVEESSRTYDEALTVYNARSALLHGARSPRDENAAHVAALAEELCRLCILCVSQLFPEMLRKHGDINSEDLERFFQELSKNAGKALAELNRAVPVEP